MSPSQMIRDMEERHDRLAGKGPVEPFLSQLASLPVRLGKEASVLFDMLSTQSGVM